jgi:hypothetical protein
MTDLHILPASEADAVAMAPHLRPADAAEVYATSGRTAEAALLAALRRSTQAWTCLIDPSAGSGQVAEPVCMWGVGPISLVAGRGCPWLLGTEVVEWHPMTFLRQSRAFLREMLQTYSELENHVDARNLLSIRWLKWLGFTIEPPQPCGFLQLPFHRFHMERADV